MLVRPRVARRKLQLCSSKNRLGTKSQMPKRGKSSHCSLYVGNLLQVRGPFARRAARGLGLRRCWSERQGVDMEELPTRELACSLSHLHLMLCGAVHLASVPFASITHNHYVLYLDQWTRHEEDVATREMAIKNDQCTERPGSCEQTHLCCAIQFAVCLSHNGSLFSVG